MSKSSIYEKIEEKGRTEAQAILEEGKQKALNAKEAMLQEAQAKANTKLATAKAKQAERVETSKTSNEQASKQAVLAEKKAKIHETFLAALEELKKMNDADLSKYVDSKLSTASLTGKEVMKVSQNDYDRYVKLFGADLAVINKKYGYTLSLSKEASPIQGGFILENASYDVDYSYEACIGELEESMETTIAGILF